MNWPLGEGRQVFRDHRRRLHDVIYPYSSHTDMMQTRECRRQRCIATAEMSLSSGRDMVSPNDERRANCRLVSAVFAPPPYLSGLFKQTARDMRRTKDGNSRSGSVVAQKKTAMRCHHGAKVGVIGSRAGQELSVASADRSHGHADRRIHSPPGRPSKPPRGLRKPETQSPRGGHPALKLVGV